MSNSPESRIREIVESLDESDPDWLTEYVHPDGELGNMPDPEFMNDWSSGVEDATYTAKTVECLDNDDESATVKLVMVIQGVAFGEHLDTEGKTTWELQKADDEWKVWDVQ